MLDIEVYGLWVVTVLFHDGANLNILNPL